MVVRLGDGRFRGRHAIVTKVRYIQRGRLAGAIEYTLAPVTAGHFGKNIFAMTVVSERFFAAPTETVDADVASDRVRGVFETRAKLNETRIERAEEGRDAIDSNLLLSLGKGDQVLVRFADYPRVEIFEGVNWKTGKVAIRQSWNKRGVRWIPAKLVERMRAEEKA